MSRRNMLLGLGLILIVGILVAQVFSQDAPPQRGPRGGQGQMDRPRQGMRGGMDPQEMRRMMQERMTERVKRNLNPTDEQWAKIEPALKKVMDLQMEAGLGMGMGRRGMRPGGRGRPGAPEGEDQPQPTSKIQKAEMALRNALDGEDKEAIEKNLEAYREAREEAKEELADAKKELKKTVTLAQEAELVLMGYLD